MTTRILAIRCKFCTSQYIIHTLVQALKTRRLRSDPGVPFAHDLISV
jgi:hypothetical protein